MSTMHQYARLLRSEGGQTLVEYAMIILLMAIALVAGLTAFSGGINAFFNTAAALFP